MWVQTHFLLLFVNKKYPETYILLWKGGWFWLFTHFANKKPLALPCLWRVYQSLSCSSMSALNLWSWSWSLKFDHVFAFAFEETFPLSFTQPVNQLNFVCSGAQMTCKSRVLGGEPHSSAWKSRLLEFKIPSDPIERERIPRFELHCMIYHDLPRNAFTLHSKHFDSQESFSHLCLPLLLPLPPRSYNSRAENKNMGSTFEHFEIMMRILSMFWCFW